MIFIALQSSELIDWWSRAAIEGRIRVLLVHQLKTYMHSTAAVADLGEDTGVKRNHPFARIVGNDFVSLNYFQAYSSLL